jgi:hypothetical protein
MPVASPGDAHHVTSRYARPLAWLLLLAAGQVASLSLIAAGNLVGYQHYRLSPEGAIRWMAVATIVVQAILVSASLRRRWPAIVTWWRRHLSVAILVMLLIAVFITSATVSKDPSFYVMELGVATAIQLVAIGNVIALAWSAVEHLSPAAGLWPLGPPDDPEPRGPDRFPLFAALWVTVVAALLAVFAYQRHPHVPDELVYLLQARYLAEGMLTLPPPPAPLAFNIDLMHYEAARWYSPVPPGWPFVLAIGAWAGVPWLVNPVLGGLNILLAHAVLGSMHGQRTARLATLFLALSPWFVFMAMNFMTHQVTLFFALLGALAVSRLRERRARDERLGASLLLAVFGGGLAIGAVSLVRPFEGLLTALLLGVWSLPPKWWKAIRGWRIAEFVPSAVLAGGAIVSGALVRPYNAFMTGDPSYFPIMAYIDKYYARGSNDLGFGPNRGLGWSGLDPFPGHGAADVVVNANLNITSINGELLGWATGSLLPVFLLLALGRLRRPDWSHVAVLATIAGLHSFYWFSGGPDFGARYWFLIIVSCAALAARGMEELDARLTSDTGKDPARAPVARHATRAALALSFAALVVYFPWRTVDKYYHYRNMRPDVPRLAAEHGFGRSLVFVRGRRHPDYASAAAYNPLDLTAGVPLYAWDSSPEAREEALRVYADRPVWILDGPTRTGDGYRVVAGPLTGADAAQRLAAP